MTPKATRYSQRFRLVSVSQVRAMDRTAQLRGKYQSACKSHGSTCICLGIGCWCSARSECTGPAAVYTWSPLEPRPVMPRRRPWQKYRKPTGVISFVVPPPKSRGCHLVHLRRARRRTTKSLPRAEPKLDRPPARPRSLWPARHRVASSRRVDSGCLRAEKTQHRNPPLLTQPVSRLSESGQACGRSNMTPGAQNHRIAPPLAVP
jgi:hypothetical protein